VDGAQPFLGGSFLGGSDGADSNHLAPNACPPLAAAHIDNASFLPTAATRFAGDAEAPVR